ncbi:hypothetical protein CDEST_07643 [Colletotrichum destructivum]|uniref:Uncharacterized protein n=1 Tax=Colletotrichum destructivum TaxID=34406 RepID=A0AAX4IIJ2_9PEZI|nr:hypothetical protein CDEST_07643 [Colletotrichum destructivum]
MNVSQEGDSNTTNSLATDSHNFGIFRHLPTWLLESDGHPPRLKQRGDHKSCSVRGGGAAKRPVPHTARICKTGFAPEESKLDNVHSAKMRSCGTLGTWGRRGICVRHSLPDHYPDIQDKVLIRAYTGVTTTRQPLKTIRKPGSAILISFVLPW